jgi:hypothetical protein
MIEASAWMRRVETIFEQAIPGRHRPTSGWNAYARLMSLRGETKYWEGDIERARRKAIMEANRWLACSRPKFWDSDHDSEGVVIN